jgi:ABC-2 type transport system permease protein
MRAWRELTWVELKLFTREPLTVVFVLVLPLVVLYVLNGVFGSQPPDPEVWEGIGAVDFYTPAYVALVVATAGVLSLPVHLAAYREQGVLRRFRATALSPVVLVAAHVAVAAITATAGAVLLSGVSVSAYDAASPQDWPGLLFAFLLVNAAFAAFAAMGVVLGLVLPTARSAQGLGVLLFFVFMMLGGAGPPRETLPGGLGAAADLTPLTYAGKVLRGPWLGTGWDVAAILAVAGLLAVSIGLTAPLLRSRNSR